MNAQSIGLATIPAVFKKQLFGIGELHKVAIEELQMRIVQTIRAEWGKLDWKDGKAGIAKASKGARSFRVGNQVIATVTGDTHPSLEFYRECQAATLYSREFESASITLSKPAADWIGKVCEKLAAEAAEAAEKAEAEKHDSAMLAKLTKEGKAALVETQAAAVPVA